MSVIISASLFTFGASAEELVRSGDVNNDSQISAADARLALRISAQLETANWLMRKHADVDGNDKITAGETLKKKTFLLNLTRQISPQTLSPILTHQNILLQCMKMTWARSI